MAAINRDLSGSETASTVSSANPKKNFSESDSDAGGVALTSTFATCMNLTTCMVGAGVLTFPKIFSSAGWYVAPPLLVFTGWVMVESGLAMTQTLAFLEARASSLGLPDGCPKSYEALAEVAIGPWGKWLSRVVFNLFMLSFGAVLLILVGSGLEIASGGALPYRAWVLVLYVPFSLMVVLGEAPMFTRVAAVGVAASVVYVLAIAIGGLLAGRDVEAKAVHSRAPSGGASFTYSLVPSSVFAFGQVQAVMLFGYGYQYQLPSVRAEMERPKELSRAICGAVGLGCVLYMTVGVLGYYGWGDLVADNVSETMADLGKCHCPGAQEAGQVLSIAVVVNMVVTFPLVMLTLARSVESMLGSRHRVAQRLGLTTAAFLMGLFCPYFLQVVGVLSSLCGTSLFLFLPLAYHWAVQAPPLLSFTALRHAVVVIVGLVALVFGLYQSLAELQEAIGQGGSNAFNGGFFDPLGANHYAREEVDFELAR